MCNPTLAVAVGAQLLGTKMQNDSFKNAQRARNEAIDSNVARRNELQDKGMGSIMESANTINQNNMATNEEKLAQLLTNTVNVPNYSMPNTGSAPRIVTDTINQELQKAARFNEQQGKAQAKLANLGDFLATRVNPQFNKSATDIGILGNKMRGEADLLGLALQDAEAKAYNPTAQLLKKGGEVATGYGLAKV
tara:strand:- start:265 stop:843 length:579 start_codon:yes stop_codon:yes gene_type:complete